jgi:hypothetical protein
MIRQRLLVFRDTFGPQALVLLAAPLLCLHPAARGKGSRGL